MCSPIITKPAPKAKKEEPKAEEKTEEAPAADAEASPDAEMGEPDAATVEEIPEDEPAMETPVDDIVRAPPSPDHFRDLANSSPLSRIKRSSQIQRPPPSYSTLLYL